MKNRFRNFFIGLFFIVPSLSYGTQLREYKGVVLDSKTREPLFMVNVARSGVSNEGTTTNDKGEFSGKFSDNKITFSYAGCDKKEVALKEGHNEILLDCGIKLDEVTIDFKKICESEPNNGTYNEKDKKCDCPEGRKWNDVRNECMVSESNITC